MSGFFVWIFCLLLLWFPPSYCLLIVTNKSILSFAILGVLFVFFPFLLEMELVGSVSERGA